jgi:hypothetical protein
MMSNRMMVTRLLTRISTRRIPLTKCVKRSYTGGLDDIWSDTPTTKLTYEEFASYNRSRSHTVHVEIKPVISFRMLVTDNFFTNIQLAKRLRRKFICWAQ